MFKGLRKNQYGHNYKLKKGDHVVMHTCIEANNPKYFGQIWICRTDEFKHKGHNYGSVFLEGFSGSFTTEFLQAIRVGDLCGVAAALSEKNS